MMYRKPLLSSISRRLLAASGIAAICSASAIAQTTLERAAATEVSMPDNAADIVVTARKQNETLLSTPASVTVLSDQELVARNITNANQLGGIIPGLVMTPGVGSVPGTTFRGLGSNAAVFNAESSVAHYQDGIYLGHFRDYVTPLYDVQQIEMIKGTQSTLLGKNTSLGAISVVNRRPDEDAGFDLRLTHSFRIDGDRAEGAVDVPVSETILTRFAFLASDEDGFYRNQLSGRQQERLRELSGRALVTFRPSDAVDATLIYQHDDRKGRGTDKEIIVDPAGRMRALAAAYGELDLNVVPDYVNTSGSDPVGGTEAARESFDHQASNRLNLIVNLDLGGHSLTAQTGYIRWKSTRLLDTDLIRPTLLNLEDFERNRAFSQEVRLSSEPGSVLDYLIGLYYYHNRYGIARDFVGSPSNNIGFPLTGRSSSDFRLKTEAYSAFGKLTVSLTEGLNINGGLRYTHERKTATFERAGTGFLGTFVFPNVPFFRYEPQTTSPIDYDIGVEYEPTTNALVYAGYSKGSKSGGFQETPTTVAGGPYSSEAAYSKEVGAKLRFPGGYFTAAVFETKVKGFQTTYTNTVGGVNQAVIGNSNIRSRGFEANVSVAPIRGLRLAGSVVHADAVFTEDFPTAGAPVGRKGDTLTRAPKWSGKLDLGYEADVGDRIAMFAGGTVDVSSRFLHQFFAQRPDAPQAVAHEIVDLRAGIRDRELGWELALLGTNVFNERYITFATQISGGGGAYGGSLNRPRVVALQLSIRR